MITNQQTMMPSSLHLYIDSVVCSEATHGSKGCPLTQFNECEARATNRGLKNVLGSIRVPEIVISGPGLGSCPSIIEIAEVAKEYSIRLCFDATNPKPILLPIECVDHVDTIIVQLDSVNPSLHDEIYQLGGLHAETMALIQYFNHERSDYRDGPRVAVKTAVRYENYRDLRKIAATLVALKCQDWLWDFATERPYSFLTDTQVRELYDDLPAIERYCTSNGIAVRTPLTTDGVADLRVLGTSLNEIAASSVGVFPSNSNCRVVTDVAILNLCELTLAACPMLARRPLSSPKISLSRDGSVDPVCQAWANPAFVEARHQCSRLTRETCINCTPALRRLHQDFKGKASSQEAQETSSRWTAIQDEGSNNVILQPIEAGGILLDYRCNAACQHCLYASDSQTRLPITRTAVTEIVSTLTIVSKGLRGFHISGGEPFLDLSLLTHTISEMVAYGLRLEFVETNGSWGSKPTARQILRDLRSCGLERIRFSASPFHEPFIERSTLEKAIDLAREILGEESVYVFDRVSFDTCPDVPVSFDLVPGGRAGYFMVVRGGGMPASEFNDSCGVELLKSGHAHFDAERNVTPGVCTGISICKVRDLPGAYSGLTLTPLIQGLVSDGPASLWHFANDNFGYEELRTGYAGKCHLCVDVRLHLVQKAASSFPELAPQAFYEGVDRYRNILLRGDMKSDFIRWDSATSRSQM